MSSPSAGDTAAGGGRRTLGVAELELWWASVAGLARSAQSVEALLSEDERRRAAGFAVEGARARFVVGRAMTRALLGRHLGLPGEQLVFAYGAHGKPGLAGAAALVAPAFNLAHSGDRVVLALTGAAEVGVDVERLQPVARAGRLAARYFAPAEAEAVLACPRAERDRLFLGLWTAREAVLKATGSGLVAGMRRVAVGPAGATEACLVGPDSRRWTLYEADVGRDYLCTVALAARAGARAAVTVRELRSL